MVLGELLDVHRFKVRGAELQHLRPEQKIAAAAGDVAQFLEREQTAARGRGGNPCAARDLAEAQGCVIARKGTDHRQTLGESSHGLAARRQCFAGWHRPSLFRYPKSRKSLSVRLTIA